MLRIEYEYLSGIIVVRLSGSLERKYIYKINNYLIPALKKHKIKYLIYNLKDLKSIDNAGMDSILNTKVVIHKNHGKIILCEVNNLLKIKRLNIKIVDTEKDALKKLEVLR